MQAERIPDVFGFEAVKGRDVVAAFDGGAITSEAGAARWFAPQDSRRIARVML